MEKAIKTLSQRVTTPSADQLQQYPVCSICWNDYEDDDQPAKLPCGHVFGKECVIAWARGTTPTGRHNGCPICRAALLPPSLHSCTSAVRYWLSDLWPFLKSELREYSGALFVGLIIVLYGTERVPDSQFITCIQFWSVAYLLMTATGRLARLLGWRWAMFTVAAMFVTEYSIRWLRGLL